MKTPFALPHDETGSCRREESQPLAKLEIAFIEAAETSVTISWGRARPMPVALGHALCDPYRPAGTATFVHNRFFRPPTEKLPLIRRLGLRLEG